MKKWCFLIILLFLTGCAAASVQYSDIDVPPLETTFFRESSADHDDPRWTEQELLTAFYQYAEDGTIIIDCVILDDSAWGMAGVVQYTTEDYPGCCFDFIRAQGLPRSVGVESLPAGRDTLTCVGPDSVTCSLLENDGSEYLCTVTYYENLNNSETGFKVIAG